MATNPYLKLQREPTQQARINPYLQLALQRDEDAKLMQHLARLVPEQPDSDSAAELSRANQPQYEIAQNSNSQLNSASSKSASSKVARLPYQSAQATEQPITPAAQPKPSTYKSPGKRQKRAYQSGQLEIDLSGSQTQAEISDQTSPPQSNPTQATTQATAQSSDYTTRISQALPAPKPFAKPVSNNTNHSTTSHYRSPAEVLKEEAERQRQEQEQLRLAALQQQQAQQRQQQEAAIRRSRLEDQAKAFLEKLNELDPLDEERMWFESFADHCHDRLEAAIEFIATMSAA